MILGMCRVFATGDHMRMMLHRCAGTAPLPVPAPHPPARLSLQQVCRAFSEELFDVNSFIPPSTGARKPAPHITQIMHHLFHLPTIIAVLTLTANAQSFPSQPLLQPLPLLIWHGLGDHHDSSGMHSIGALAQQIHPGTHVHYIRLAESGTDDRTASFFGNVSEQIAQVCKSVLADPEVKAVRGRVDAVGFSQGGQFLRGLVQTCGAGLNVRSLVTWGSQHNGIVEFRGRECGRWDLVCRGAMGWLKGNVWAPYVQGRVVPAQYFRPVGGGKEYLEASGWLAEANNERVGERKEVYAERLARLDRFVMYVFQDDETVVPPESGWFAEVKNVSVPRGEQGREVVPLRDRSGLYGEDWLGLRKLDKKGGLVFREVPGKHMELREKDLVEAFREFFGPEREEQRWDKLGQEVLSGT